MGPAARSPVADAASDSGPLMGSIPLLPSRDGMRMAISSLRYPRRLSRRSSRSNPLESPRRLSKILRATSRRAPTSGSRSAYRTDNPSFCADTCPDDGARPIAARRSAGPARVAPAAPAPCAPSHEDFQHSNPRGMSECTEELRLEHLKLAGGRWLATDLPLLRH